jgi:transcriptional regulator with XRE-family HTH domain
VDAGVLKEWRKEYGLSQKRLAQALGISVQAVAHWEQGLRRLPALLPLALEALGNRMRREAQPKTEYREGKAMNRYEVRMTVYSTVEAGSSQEAKDKAMELLRANPVVDELWVTQTTKDTQKAG